MKWTKTPPSEPGWYWWRGDGGNLAQVREVIIVREFGIGPPGSRETAYIETPEARLTAEWIRGEWWPEPIEPPA